MKIHAYLMAADLAWIEASVLSYYSIVDKIVVSYAEDSMSWSGTPIRVDECLERLRAIDKDSKFSFEPGVFYSSDRTPMQSDTFQRQQALKSAGEGADWVLQLDTDEVLFRSDTFLDCLRDADATDCVALRYPARWIYQHLRDNDYLEMCNRFWKIRSSYPGPIAVRPGVSLHTARQCEGKGFHVDFAPQITDPSFPPSMRVDRVIAPEDGIFHFSWVRSRASLERKLQSWSHSTDRNWDSNLEAWWKSRKNTTWRILRGFISLRESYPMRRVTLDMPDFILPQYRDED